MNEFEYIVQISYCLLLYAYVLSRNPINLYSASLHIPKLTSKLQQQQSQTAQLTLAYIRTTNHFRHCKLYTHQMLKCTTTTHQLWYSKYSENRIDFWNLIAPWQVASLMNFNLKFLVNFKICLNYWPKEKMKVLSFQGYSNLLKSNLITKN